MGNQRSEERELSDQSSGRSFLSYGGNRVMKVLKQYPTLEKNDIHACLVFESKLMGRKYLLQEIARNEKILDRCKSSKSFFQLD